MSFSSLHLQCSANDLDLFNCNLSLQHSTLHSILLRMNWELNLWYHNCLLFWQKKNWVSLCEQSIYSISIWRHHFHFMKCQVTSLFLCVIQKASCLSHFAAIHATVLCEREQEQIEREYILACILYSWINSLWMSYIFPACVCIHECVRVLWCAIV